MEKSYAHIPTSMKLALRLYARKSGTGDLMYQMPYGLEAVVARMIDSDPLGSGHTGYTVQNWVITFAMPPEFRAVCHDVRVLSKSELISDASDCRKLLEMVATFGKKDTANSISLPEMAYLQDCLGLGSWCQGIKVEGCT